MTVLRFCHSCNADLPLATEPFGKPIDPTPGDFAICIKCGAWNTFTKTGLREPTIAEYVQIAGDRDAQRVLTSWRHVDAAAKARARRREIDAKFPRR